MNWWILAASIASPWLLWFIDDHTVLELRLLFHALTKTMSHLYLVVLALSRATGYFFNCARYLVTHVLQRPQYGHRQPPALHLIEAMRVVCEVVANLTCAALSVGAALCHAMLGLYYVLIATLRTIQPNLFS